MTLNKIAWAFTDERYNSYKEFNHAVIAYQKDIHRDENCWKPDEIVFDFPALQIQYKAWINGPEDLLENETLIDDHLDVFEEETEEDIYRVEILAKLTADNGKNFSALEFLMKAHNQQASKDLGDHHFFQGTDVNSEAMGELPTCYINCGS